MMPSSAIHSIRVTWLGICLPLLVLSACVPSTTPLAPADTIITPISTQAEMEAVDTQLPQTQTPTATLEPTLSLPEENTTVPENTIPPDVVAAVQTQYAILQTPVTPTPSSVYRRATRTPTPSPTPRLPMSVLRIYKPGAYSRLASPFTIEGAVVTGPGGKIYLELIGEDGRMISQDVLRFGMADGLRFGIAPEVKFEIGAVAEAARLQMRTENTRGQTIALSSVNVILLSLGEPELTGTSPAYEPFVIQSPRTDTEVSGGVLLIQGSVRPVNESPVLVELRTEDGALLGSTQFDAEMATETTNTPFEIAVPYAVQDLTHALLIFKQTGDRIPGVVALTSTTLWLKP